MKMPKKTKAPKKRNKSIGKRAKAKAKAKAKVGLKKAKVKVKAKRAKRKRGINKELELAKKGIAPAKGREWKHSMQINGKRFTRWKSTNSERSVLNEFNKLERRKSKGVIKSIRLKEDRSGHKNKRYALFIRTKSMSK